MAVTKLWPVKTNLRSVIRYAENPEKTRNTSYTPEQVQALADVLSYAKDEEKTERAFFVEGIHCNPETAREQFVTVKAQYGKEDSIQAYHGYLSFQHNEVTPEQAQQIGMEFAERVWGKRFQVLVTTHLNTKHLHCHFVINSVSYVDGKRLANDEKAWFKFRHVADEICRAHGVSVIEHPERNREPEYFAMQTRAGKPTRQTLLKAALDEALVTAQSWAELSHILRGMGYTVNRNPNRKYVTVLPKGAKQPIRLYRLGEDYTESRIEERFAENRGKVQMQTFQKRTVRFRQYNLPTRGTLLRKKGGLYGLYLYYCYRLGSFQPHKARENHRLHPLLRDDLMRLDELTAQTQLLGRAHISTSEELFAYKAKAEGEIETLLADRKRLRNEIRKVGQTDAMLFEAKERISSITARLKDLRKDVRLCEGIAERSGVLQEKVQAILAEGQKMNGKEWRDHEQRR